MIFEYRVAARVLTALLGHDSIPGLGGPVHEVRLQQRIFDRRLDDVVVISKPETGPLVTLDCPVSTSTAFWAELWRDFPDRPRDLRGMLRRNGAESLGHPGESTWLSNWLSDVKTGDSAEPPVSLSRFRNRRSPSYSRS